MPSMLHEALVDLFRARPELAAEVLSETLEVELPEYDSVKQESIDFTQIIPTEYRADLVVLLYKNKPVLAMVVEVQLERDTDKRLSWPVYVTTLRARFDCQACLLVISPLRAIASWCAQKIEMGHKDFVLKPYVLGPDGIPVITEEDEARRSPEMAVMSTLAHGRGEQAYQVAAAALGAALGLDDERALFYTDLILHAVEQAVRQKLEALMRSGTYEYQSEFARKYFGQGKVEGHTEGVNEGIAKGKAEGIAKGKAEGKAESILAVLEGRGVEVTDSQRETILACRELDQLDRWLQRALTISQVDELFE